MGAADRPAVVGLLLCEWVRDHASGALSSGDSKQACPHLDCRIHLRSLCRPTARATSFPGAGLCVLCCPAAHLAVLQVPGLQLRLEQARLELQYL